MLESTWTKQNPPTLLVQFNHSVGSDSLWPDGRQHSRLPCPSPTLGACSNSCALSRWSHPTITSCVIPFSSCLQSFPESGSFLMSHFFTSGDQSIGISASASVLPVNIQGWFPLGWTGLISSQSKGLSRVFSNTSTHSGSPLANRSQTLQCHSISTQSESLTSTAGEFSFYQAPRGSEYVFEENTQWFQCKEQRSF